MVTTRSKSKKVEKLLDQIDASKLSKEQQQTLNDIKDTMKNDKTKKKRNVDFLTKPKSGEKVYELSKKQETYMKDLYFEKKMKFGRDRVYQYIQQDWNKNSDKADRISRRMVANWLSKNEVHQLYTPIKKLAKGDVKKTILDEPFSQVGIDLIDYTTKQYKNFKWLLTGIDLFSKKGYAVPMKDKEGKTVSQAMEKMLKSMLKLPSSVRSDNGSEFIDEHFKKTLLKNNIKQIFSKASTPQSNGNIERFNGILKRALEMDRAQTNNNNWLKSLPIILKAYNATISRVTKKSPDMIEQESFKDNKKTKANIEKAVLTKNNNTLVPKFKIGDRVRITMENIGKSKSFRKWSIRIYQIRKVFKANSKTVLSTSYQLSDSDGDSIKEKFYENELQLYKPIDQDTRIKEPQKFIISKIIRFVMVKKDNKQIPSYEVAWRGYRSKKDRTIEPRTQLMIDVPKLVADFDKKNKVLVN